MSSLRLDRAGTLYISTPLLSGAKEWDKGCLPILMYHTVSLDAEEAVRPYYRVATSPQRFAEQMQWLTDLGYVGLAVEEALSLVTNGNVNGIRPVAITFDDGFRDFHTQAWPVLQRHDFTATAYLPTDFISCDRKSFRDKECLIWPEVR